MLQGFNVWLRSCDVRSKRYGGDLPRSVTLAQCKAAIASIVGHDAAWTDNRNSTDRQGATPQIGTVVTFDSWAWRLRYYVVLHLFGQRIRVLPPTSRLDWLQYVYCVSGGEWITNWNGGNYYLKEFDHNFNSVQVLGFNWIYPECKNPLYLIEQ